MAALITAECYEWNNVVVKEFLWSDSKRMNTQKNRYCLCVIRSDGYFFAAILWLGVCHGLSMCWNILEQTHWQFLGNGNFTNDISRTTSFADIAFYRGKSDWNYFKFIDNGRRPIKIQIDHSLLTWPYMNQPVFVPTNCTSLHGLWAKGTGLSKSPKFSVSAKRP